MVPPDYVTGDIFVFRPNNQTLRAWEPFWDCVSILFEIQNSDFVDDGNELTEWRPRWIAGITLLRAIGHVLAKVDATKSASHKSAIDLFWSRIKANRQNYTIFWEFIDRERNNILKTYVFGTQFKIIDDEHRILYSDGSDAFQLYRYAVYWWRKELMDLEDRLL